MLSRSRALIWTELRRFVKLENIGNNYLLFEINAFTCTSISCYVGPTALFWLIAQVRGSWQGKGVHQPRCVHAYKAGPTSISKKK